MKVKKIIESVAIVTAFVCVAWLVSRLVLVGIFMYVDRWAWAVEYKDYASEFNTVKDYVMENYASEEEKWVSVSFPLNSPKDFITLYDPDTKEYAELPEDVKAALETIADEAFSSDAHLHTIRICSDRIDFCTQVPYALVYSPDEKPTWMYNYNNPTDIRVKKIGDGWYHVRDK